jgi:hypothetical protein
VQESQLLSLFRFVLGGSMLDPITEEGGAGRVGAKPAVTKSCPSSVNCGAESL